MKLSNLVSSGLRKKILSLAFGTVSGFALMENAQARQPEAYVVLDGNGHFVDTHNSENIIIPASTVKLMTAYILLERVQAGLMTLDDPIQVTQRRLNADERQLGLKAGTTITVRQALDMILIYSANDAAISVAEEIAFRDTGERSEENFVKIMNEKAYELGMHDTIFANASGLDVPVNRSTPTDMAYLAYSFVHKFPELFDGKQGADDVPDYTSGRAFRWNNEPHYNTNALVQMGTIRHRGVEFKVDGLKTGWLAQAGSCLLTSATAINPQNNMPTRLVVAYFGGKSGADRNSRVVNILSNAFKTTFDNQSQAWVKELKAEMREAIRADLQENLPRVQIENIPVTMPTLRIPPAPQPRFRR